MSNMGLRGTTRPITLEDNGRYHHPSRLGDDKMLSPNCEMPSVAETGSRYWLYIFWLWVSVSRSGMWCSGVG